MAELRPITIIGGGLAGLTLGIGLRQRGIPVIIWETAHYPRHRVCGEFISGRGQESLRRLGLFRQLSDIGVIQASTAQFFSRKWASAIQVLPEPAICVSRFNLDGFLAAEFERLGGDLKTCSRWKDSFDRAGVIRATGRRIHNEVNGWRWFGLKVHARNVNLTADLEMHFGSRGYVGLCRLSDEVNVCGLFRSREPLPQLQTNWRDWLCGDEDSILRDRLSQASFDEQSFCTVAGLSLRPESEVIAGECRIGDSLTMIPPVTGNGMSMAFESAEMAVQPLERYSRGERSWPETWGEIAQKCKENFRQRLKWASWLQAALFQKYTRRILISAGLNVPGLRVLLFERTR